MTNAETIHLRDETRLNVASLLMEDVGARRDVAIELASFPLDEDLVGVEVEDPVRRGRVEGDVARGGEVVLPRVVQDAGAVLQGDLHGPVRRPGVDDDELVDPGGGGGQAAPEHRLLVLDDHAERQRQTLGGARGRGLDLMLSQETGLPIHVDGDPLTGVVRGTGRILDDEDKYWSVLTT